jgi:GNAT superfamily N-acetyltransferase
MNMAIRKANTGDVGDLTRLSAQLGYAIAEDTTLKNLNAILQNNHEAVFVASYENEVIGWIHVFATVRLESGPFCEIGGLVVHKQWQQKGIGKNLVLQAKQWTIGKGYTVLKVRCKIKRKAAHQFYRQMGFTENKVQTVFELRV